MGSEMCIRDRCISEFNELSTRCILKVLRICITLSFIHFRPIICELRAIDASKLNTANLLQRCVQLRAIRLHLNKMHAMVARKLHRVDAALGVTEYCVRHFLAKMLKKFAVLLL